VNKKCYMGIAATKYDAAPPSYEYVLVVSWRPILAISADEAHGKMDRMMREKPGPDGFPYMRDCRVYAIIDKDELDATFGQMIMNETEEVKFE